MSDFDSPSSSSSPSSSDPTRDPRFDGPGSSDSSPSSGPPAGGEEGTESPMDELKVQMLLDRLRGEQNLGAGVAGGAAAAALGAVLWAVVTVATGYQIGWMAIAVGFLVGWAVRALGKGVDRVFGVAGAVLALAGCLVGNVLSVYGFAASQMEIPVSEVISMVDFATVLDIMVETFSPMDLLFYGLAVYEGYQLSFRQMTEEELEKAAGEVG